MRVEAQDSSFYNQNVKELIPIKFHRFAWSLLIMLAIVLTGSQTNAQAAETLRIGSSSGDVWDVQYRLQTLGLYTQPLDGKYGPQTAAAVTRFQQTYGLAADGVTGAQTWQALRKYTLNQEEMDILARVIYSEARGESYTGQVAVGAVVMNRIESPLFPNTIKGVVFQPWAFTAVNDGQYWLTPDRTAYSAALDAVRGWDPSGGAIYYYNPVTATNTWIRSRSTIVQIGRHVFAK